MTSTERTAWLRRRQQGIGGTDIASIAGVGFQTAMQVYEEKVAAEPIDRAPSPLMLMGLATEQVNADLYSLRRDVELAAPGMVWNPYRHWQFATFDRVEESDHLRPVELKYTPFFGDRWGPDGSDEIPDAYLIQATWQAHILRESETKSCDPTTAVSALSGSGDHRVYSIPFDPDLADLLIEIGAAFWRFVEARQPPYDWTHPLQKTIADRLTKIRPDTSLELGEREHSLALAYRDAREREKEAKEQAESCKSELIHTLGTFETGRLPDGTRIRQRVVQRKAYTVEAGSYVDFRILTPSKKVKASSGNEI